MTDIIEFPHNRTIHTFDMRDVKRLTPQIALKSCVAQLDNETADYLKSVVFGKWPLLKDATENSAFMFTSCFPLDQERPLVASAARLAARAYRDAPARNILDRPTAYLEVLIQTLDQHANWQPVGLSTDFNRRQVWSGPSQPLPVWLRRNDLFTLEFTKHPTVSDLSYSRWLILASKLMPAGGHDLLDHLIARRYNHRELASNE